MGGSDPLQILVEHDSDALFLVPGGGCHDQEVVADGLGVQVVDNHVAVGVGQVHTVVPKGIDIQQISAQAIYADSSVFSTNAVIKVCVCCS